ncbi:MAG: hypothetical protein H7301_13115 [Cryobacterium sp.]|nr:hypothetical protein [Oligoflexia bacterium]
MKPLLYLMPVAITVACVASSPAQAIELKAKGFIKVGAVGANRAVNSFGQENLAAPTAARPQGDFTLLDKEVTSFQAAQTRLGMEAIVDPTTRGYVEFDFIDFTKASPTTQMVPRVRIAKIDYDFSETRRLTVGQDWDIFSPTNTSTYNYVGNNFQAGNSGFMRSQAILTDRHGDLEMRYALGMVGSNATATNADIEKSDLPTFAVAAAYGTGMNRVGVSAIGSRLKLADGSPRGYASRGVYGLSAFGEKSVGTGSIRAEVYTSQNLENTGSLTLSRGRAATSVRDVGGFLSGKFPLDEAWSLFGTAGLATVRNKGAVSNASTLTAGRRSFDATTLGITTNVAVKLGIDHKLSEKLSWFTELSRFNTVFKDFGNGHSYVVDAGLFLSI